MSVRVGVIIPTIGRPTLAAAIASVRRQARRGDAIVVVADGASDAARAIVQAARFEEAERPGGPLAVIDYDEVDPPERRWGAAPRNRGITRALELRVTHVAFLDDDDEWQPEARAAIEVVGAKPEALWLFRGVLSNGSTIWRDRTIALGNVGTPNILAPAIAAALARWPPVHEGDLRFIEALAEVAPVVWDEAVVYRQRQVPAPTPAPRRPRTVVSCAVCHRAVHAEDVDEHGRCCFCGGLPLPPAAPAPIADVQGWFWHEADLLALLRRIRPARVVEVGTWLGRSAIPQALALKEWGGTLTCVDPFDGGAELRARPELAAIIPQSEAICRANLARYGCDNAEVWRTTSTRAAARWKREKRLAPGLVYVDGAHDEASVLADLRAWWPLVGPGGAMAGDDYGSADYPGVTRAWEAFAVEQRLDLRTAGARGTFTLAWFQKEA